MAWLTVIGYVLAGIIVAAGLAFLHLRHWLDHPPLPKIRRDGVRVACIGDSITHGGGGLFFKDPNKSGYAPYLQEMFGEKYLALNYGHNGRTLLQSGDYPYRQSLMFTASQNSDPAIVLIMLGTNDSKPHNWNAEEYERELAEFVQIYKSLPGNPTTYLMVPPAAFVRKGKKEVVFDIRDTIIENEIVPIVKRVAEQIEAPLIDMFSATQDHPEYFQDGVHPNKLGSKALAKTIFEVLNTTIS
ncbi:MAG: hypothetical protein H6667_18165 [Ardenticatenaceae bacterium]|nr:hypothetical protein [Ardenticatenaceae bacterium]